MCLGVFRFLVISVRKFSQLYLSRCACVNCVNLNVFVLLLELLLVEVPVSLLHPMVIQVYGKRVSLTGHPAIQLHHELSSVLTVFLRRLSRFFRVAINPLHTMTSH